MEAYEFLRSTYDAKVFRRTSDSVHGWVKEAACCRLSYQSGLGVESLAALLQPGAAILARAM